MKKSIRFFKIYTHCMACMFLYLYTDSLSAQISINSMNPASGHIGTSVTIKGSNFNTTPANNIVIFGSTAGTVTGCTDTSITAIVNSGASYQNVSVSNTFNKEVALAKPFNTTFSCGGEIDSNSFGLPTNYTSGNSPRSISSSDLDGDGLPDMIIANSTDSTVSILKRLFELSGYSYAPPVQLNCKMSPQDIAIGDVTGDGKPDIAVVSKDSNMVTVFRNTRVGNSISFNQKVSFQTGLSPKGISLADIDRDGRLEIVVTNEGENTVSVFKNTVTPLGGVSYNNKIDFPSGASPRSIVAEDIDNDGLADIVTANYGGNNFSVLRNTSSGGSISFDSKVDFTTGAGPQDIKVADIDADGINDVIVTNNGSGTLSVLKNTSSSGSVSFATSVDATTGIGPINVAVGDIDGDGSPDLAVTNTGSNSISVFKNNSTIGTVSLEPKVDFTALSAPIGVAVGDFDGDGKSDLGATNDNAFCLLLNTTHIGPKIVGLTTHTICSGSAVNFSLVTNAPSTYSWSANDNTFTTGESLTNHTSSIINDTLVNTSASSQTVTYPIILTSTDGNCVSTPQTLQVIVLPLPNANAGVDSALTCNNPTLLLTGNSSDSPVSYQWNPPVGATSNTQTITANTAGTYTLVVTNNTTLCANTDSVLVSYDTITPIITCPVNYQITNCIPGTVTINGTTDNNTDSVKWFGSGIPTDNPAVISNQNNYLLWTKRNSNGCVNTSTVSVTIQTVTPIIALPIGMDTLPLIPILDTLTCAHDSILLSFMGSTASSKIKVVRPAPMNDTVNNNSYALLPGIYKAIINDTVSGCNGNSLLFELKINVTLPQLIAPAVIPELNCSVNSVTLTGISGTPNSSINWTGPNNFSSTNPATANQAGDYVISVTDLANGCVKSDTLALVYQSILLLNESADTTICKGDTAQLNVSAVGGIAPFVYSWNNSFSNSAIVNVSPVDTTHYIVTVIDSAGCAGQDTITVNIPTPIADSTLTFHLCDPNVPNGEIQIYASNGIPPYQYSITNGLSFQTSPIFTNLPFGNYPILITDAMNCSHVDSTIINTLSQKPVADFIVSTNMMQADTFVVVDISNPRPDTILWTFPNTVNVIDTNPFAPVIVSSDTGAVDIGMEIHFGSCIMYLTKNVQFLKADSLLALPNGNGIEEITLYPNPNNGQFSVEVKLYKKQTFGIYVYNSQGIEQARVIVPESNYSLNSIAIPNPLPGTYLLKVIAEYDSKSKTIVVTQ